MTVVLIRVWADTAPATVADTLQFKVEPNILAVRTLNALIAFVFVVIDIAIGSATGATSGPNVIISVIKLILSSMIAASAVVAGGRLITCLITT